MGGWPINARFGFVVVAMSLFAGLPDGLSAQDGPDRAAAGNLMAVAGQVPGSRVLVDATGVELDVSHVFRVFREFGSAGPLYVYDRSHFHDNCQRWEDRKLPWTDFTVDEAAVIVRPGDGIDQVLGLPFRQVPDSAQNRYLPDIAHYVEQLVKSQGGDASASDGDGSVDWQSYANLPPVEDVKLSEACSVLDSLPESHRVQIATSRKVPSWEVSAILLPREWLYLRQPRSS